MVIHVPITVVLVPIPTQTSKTKLIWKRPDNCNFLYSTIENVFATPLLKLTYKDRWDDKFNFEVKTRSKEKRNKLIATDIVNVLILKFRKKVDKCTCVKKSVLKLKH